MENTNTPKHGRTKSHFEVAHHLKNLIFSRFELIEILKKKKHQIQTLFLFSTRKGGLNTSVNNYRVKSYSLVIGRLNFF